MIDSDTRTLATSLMAIFDRSDATIERVKEDEESGGMFFTLRSPMGAHRIAVIPLESATEWMK